MSNNGSENGKTFEESLKVEAAPPPKNRGFMGIFDMGAFVGTFSLLVILLAGGGFIYKLTEFVRSIRGADAMVFAIMPITIYLIVAAGFMCLFLWAFLNGKFADLEAAKYTMLEQEEAYERAEQAARRA